MKGFKTYTVPVKCRQTFDGHCTLSNMSDQGNSSDTINVKTQNADKTKHSGVAREVTDPTKADSADKTNIMNLKEKTKAKKAKQPKIKAISEKKKLSKERRKKNTAKRRLALEEYHVLAKKQRRST